MCGIVGVYHFNGEPVSARLLQQMTDVLAHRGPDGEGCHVDGPLGLGHRRLAVLDPSPLGRQPMANPTGEIVLTFNGEIYNFRALRAELESAGHRFLSQTDTEVVLHAYQEWGEECVGRFNGMFALGIHDRARRRLFLARDRYGVKPLYWYHRDGVFLFGSEIKAMLAHPRVRPAVCYEALNEYCTFQNIFSDLTLFQGVRLLAAGTTLRLDFDSGSGPRICRYWDYPFPARPVSISEEDCVEQVRGLFEQAVRRQLVSDVPVGAYLSGGMDSSSIVGVASRQVDRLTTFTGGFDLSTASGLELGFDERRAAERLSQQFGTEHHEVVIHAGDMEWSLPGLIWHLEDLRVGQSYPNYYAARLASRFVKVVLSGVGGDELFGGYPWRYFHAAASTSAADYFQRYYRLWQRVVSDADRPRFFNAAALRQIGDHSPFETFREVYRSYPGELESKDDFLNASLYFELKTFLHGLLVVEDKLSMAYGLESRVPFLDDDLVNFACRVPVGYKLRSSGAGAALDENALGSPLREVQRGSDGKQVFRRAMSRLVPPAVTEATKQGFSAPDASWFRGESLEYVRRLVCNPRANIYEFIDPIYVHSILEQHCSGRVNSRLAIWSLLSLEWWLAHFVAGSPASPSRNPGLPSSEESSAGSSVLAETHRTNRR